MILAEFSIYHSRPIAPTRRIALGDRALSCDPSPGFGGILLGGVVANFAIDLDDDLAEELPVLIADLALRGRVTQPRFWHRFQTDRVGMARSTHRLLHAGDAFNPAWSTVEFEFENNGTAAQQVLGSLYTAATFRPEIRVALFEVLFKASVWRGPIGPSLVAHLSGRGGGTRLSPSALADPVAWALELLGLKASPTAKQVSKRFRILVIEAHPDHGADEELAATRIADLTEARRILS